jgi:hypothetical protein
MIVIDLINVDNEMACSRACRRNCRLVLRTMFLRAMPAWPRMTKACTTADMLVLIEPFSLCDDFH